MFTHALLVLALASGSQDTMSPWLVLDGDVNVAFREHVIERGAEPPSAGDEWREVTWLDRPAELAYRRIEQKEDGVQLFTGMRARTLIVNGVPFSGDPDHIGHPAPVPLKRGVNHVFLVNARAFAKLELERPAHAVLIARELLDLRRGSDRARFPVLNTTNERIEFTHVHFGNNWRDGTSIEPLALAPAEVLLDPFEEKLQVSVYGNDASDVDQAFVPADFSARPPSTIAFPNSAFEKILRQSGDVVLVYGEGYFARARQDQALLAQRTGIVARLVSGERFVADAKHVGFDDVNPILYGNSNTNAAWNEVAGATPHIAVTNGKLRIESKVHEGDDLSGFFVLEHKAGVYTKRHVGFVADTGGAGARFGILHLALFEKSDEDYVFRKGGVEVARGSFEKTPR